MISFLILGRISSEVTKYFCLGSRPSDRDLSQSGRGGAHGARFNSRAYRHWTVQIQTEIFCYLRWYEFLHLTCSQCTYVAWIRIRVSYRIRYGYGDMTILKNLGYDTPIIYIIFYYFNYIINSTKMKDYFNYIIYIVPNWRLNPKK